MIPHSPLLLAAIVQAAPTGGGGLGMFVPMLLMFAVFYFMLIRPQQKKAKLHQEWLQSLKKGDEVATSGGLVGRITHLQGPYVTLEMGEPKIRLKVLRSSVTGKPPDANAPAP